MCVYDDNYMYSRLFPSKYPEFNARFDTLCRVDPDKLPIELTMAEFGEIIDAYQQILDVFPELATYDVRYNQSF